MRVVERFDGTSSSFVVQELDNGKFAVEQHFDHSDGFVTHQTFTAKYRAVALAEQLAKHS